MSSKVKLLSAVKKTQGNIALAQTPRRISFMDAFLQPIYEFRDTPILLHIGGCKNTAVRFVPVLFAFIFDIKEANDICGSVCFIPTINTFSYYKSWCSVAQPKNFHHSFLHFTCFNFQYCDRSHWNCGSLEEDRVQRLPSELRERIRDIATSGLNVEDNEDEADDMNSEAELYDEEEEDFL
jgi:hypothetical protein